jgi:hypothetical protein
MIENPYPERWQELQTCVCSLFKETGFTAEASKKVSTPRGEVELDVYAVDEHSVNKTRYVVECRNWSSTITQSEVYGFTEVMRAAGANIGYIVSKKGFQAEAIDCMKNTNITVLPYSEVQRWFFEVWYSKVFVPKIGVALDDLSRYVKPEKRQIWREMGQLIKSDKRKSYELQEIYRVFQGFETLFESSTVDIPAFSAQFDMFDWSPIRTIEKVKRLVALIDTIACTMPAMIHTVIRIVNK